MKKPQLRNTYRNMFVKQKNLSLVENQDYADQEEQLAAQHQGQQQQQQQQQREQKQKRRTKQALVVAQQENLINLQEEEHAHGQDVLTMGTIIKSLEDLMEHRIAENDCEASYTASLNASGTREVCSLLAAEACKLAMSSVEAANVEALVNKYADLMYLSFLSMKQHNVSPREVVVELGRRIAESDGAEFLDGVWYKTLGAAEFELKSVAAAQKEAAEKAAKAKKKAAKSAAAAKAKKKAKQAAKKAPARKKMEAAAIEQQSFKVEAAKKEKKQAAKATAAKKAVKKAPKKVVKKAKR